MAPRGYQSGCSGPSGGAPQPARRVHGSRHAQSFRLPGEPEVKTAALALVLAAISAAQGLDPAALLKAPTDTWPTYNGDYSGRRYSTLKQINQSNVNQLTLAWMAPLRTTAIKATPLLVNGVLYLTTPDNVWA